MAGARQRTEEALRRTEGRFRSLIEHALDLIAVIGSDDTIRYASPSYEHVLGYHPEEMIGVNLFTGIHPADGPVIIEELAQVRRDPGSIRPLEFRQQHKNGSWRHIAATGLHSRDQPGDVILNARDITDRKQIENALRASEERFQALVEQSPDAIFVNAADSTITYAAPSVTRVLGYTSEDLIGRRAFDLIHPDDQEGAMQRLGDLLSRPGAWLDAQFRVQHKDGSWRWVDGRGTNLLEHSSVNGIVTLLRDSTERREAEEALRESEAQFVGLFECAPDATLVVELDGCIARANRQAEQLFGYSRRELIGQPVEMLIPARVADQHASHRTTYGADPSLRAMGAGLDLSARRKDGSEVAVDISLSSLATPEGPRMLANIRDVTERKRIKRDLRRVNRALRTLIDCNRTLVRATDESQLLHDICDLIVNIGGYRFAWVGFAEQNAEHTVRPVAWAGYEAGYLGSVMITWTDTQSGHGPAGTAIRTAEPCVVRNILTDEAFTTWRAKAHERGYASLIGIPLIHDALPFGVLTIYSAEADAFDSEEVLLLVQLAHDLAYGVSALGARAARREAEGRLQLMLEQTPAILWTADTEFRCVSIAGAGLASLNVLPDAVLGMSAWEYFQTTDPNHPVLAAVRRAHHNESGDFDFDWRGRTFAVHVRPFQDRAGTVVGVIGLAQDITDRKQADEAIRQLNADLEQRVIERTAQLELANNELEAFSYSVSHDLRAPLRAIDGFSHALVEEYAGTLEAGASHYLERIRAGTLRMGQLIEDLLRLSHVQRGELHRERVDLSALVHAIATELRQTAPERVVEFVIAEGGVTQGDSRLLRVALENLLGNAWKYTSKRPTARIEFGMSEKAGQPSYFVRDDGTGFDMEYAEKLFGAFQRLDSAQEFSGTGIGLAIVQRIIHRHGGRVWADAALDKGATFYFTLHPE